MHWRTVRGGRVMSDDDHIAQLMKGVAAWNTWRDEKRLTQNGQLEKRTFAVH
jgi:hypothetical protein